MDEMKAKATEETFNEETFNSYAETLVKQLPDHIGEQVLDLAREFKVPLWQMVCGFMLDSYQLGRLSSFQLDPAWKDGFRSMKYTCMACGKEFKARRINQQFCSNECGLGLTTEETTDDSAYRITPVAPPDSSVVGDGDPSDSDPEAGVLDMLDTVATETLRAGVSTDIDSDIRSL